MSKIRLANQKRFFRELLSYRRYLLSNPSLPEKKFVIFGRGRSGSTLLVNLLDSHPQIQCDNEILHDKVFFPRHYIDCCASCYPFLIYGFKLLSYQVRDVQRILKPEKFIGELSKSGYKIIYLKRDNLVYHALSNIYARQKNKFHYRSNEDKVEKQPIYVAVDELFQWINHSEQLNNFEQQILKNISHLSLSYEKNLQQSSSQQTTADLIFKFLDITSVPVKTNLVKATPMNLEATVKNHKEIFKSLKNTQYSKFLEYEYNN